jgi:hypothetical protein
MSGCTDLWIPSTPFNINIHNCSGSNSKWITVHKGGKSFAIKDSKVKLLLTTAIKEGTGSDAVLDYLLHDIDPLTALIEKWGYDGINVCSTYIKATPEEIEEFRQLLLSASCISGVYE